MKTDNQSFQPTPNNLDIVFLIFLLIAIFVAIFIFDTGPNDREILERQNDKDTDSMIECVDKNKNEIEYCLSVLRREEAQYNVSNY